MHLTGLFAVQCERFRLSILQSECCECCIVVCGLERDAEAELVAV